MCLNEIKRKQKEDSSSTFTCLFLKKNLSRFKALFSYIYQLLVIVFIYRNILIDSFSFVKKMLRETMLFLLHNFDGGNGIGFSLARRKAINKGEYVHKYATHTF